MSRFPHGKSRSPSARATLVAPAPAGVGGLGGAVTQMQAGLEACGVTTEVIGPPRQRSVGFRLAHQRPLRAAPVLGRAMSRREVMRNVPTPLSDLVWAVPGFLPEVSAGTWRVLHCATFHPRTVRAQVAEAQGRAGGGRGFISGSEVRRLVREIDEADVIRTEGRAVSLDLAAHGVDPGRIVECRPGVDLERFRPGPKPERLSIAFIGTFSVWKGIDVLLATSRNLRGIADVRTIGGPVDRFTRRLVASAPFEPSVDPPALLSTSHALLLPSASDGFGYVVLEAMASGAVPFVTPTVGAAHLVAELDSQLVVPAAEYADAVPDLLRSLPLDEFADKARRLAEAHGIEEMRERAASAILRKLGLPCSPPLSRN